MGKSKTTAPNSGQTELMLRHGLIPTMYLVLADTAECLQLVSRISGQTYRIKKAAGVSAPCGLCN